jgi:cellulose synthase (UDP-forming)
LVKEGYRWADLPRVYALNLALIPVNLGGVLASLRQAITGRKSAFLRTPKVTGRTAATAAYLFAEYALLGFCLLGGVVDALNARWLHSSFALINGDLLGYAVLVFIGLRASVEDVVARFGPILRQAVLPVRPDDDLPNALRGEAAPPPLREHRPPRPATHMR